MTDMEAKVQELWKRLDLCITANEEMMVQISFLTEAHREGMEEAAKYIEQRDYQGGRLMEVLATEIREKIDGKSTVVKNGN